MNSLEVRASAKEWNMVKFTDVAAQKVLGLLKNEKRLNPVLRMAIDGRGPGGFAYNLRFVQEDERAVDDVVVDAGGFKVFIDAKSAPNLSGATVDYVAGPQGSGFRFENPNPLWADPRAATVQRVLDEEINPAVAQHGGSVTLLDVKDDIVYIALGGGCQGCGMVDVTLKQGIEVRIKEAVPEIRQIVDSTDHAGGTNPFYRPTKGGQSPFA